MRTLPLSMIGAMSNTDLKKVSEEDFQKAVSAFASQNGWLVHYQRRSGFVGEDGTWRGSGPKGFPDLVLAKNGRVLFAELKREGGQLTKEQRQWGFELGDLWHLWRPRNAKEIVEELEQ